MRADVAAIASLIAMVVIVGLLVRFSKGSIGLTKATTTGVQGWLVELENPGRFEKVA